MQISKIELVTGEQYWVRLRFANGKIAMNTEVYNERRHALKVFDLFKAAFPKAKAVHVDNVYKG